MSTRVLLKKSGVSHIAQKDAVLSVKAVAGETYQLTDAQTNKPVKHVKKTIVGNNLILQNSEDDTEVHIVDYVTANERGAIDVVFEATADAAVGATSSPIDWMWVAGGAALIGAVAAAAGGGGSGGGGSAPAPVVDTIAPTVALGAGQVDASNKTMLVTFTLSEAATDFSAADVVVTGGTLSNFSGSGTSYTATITAAAFDAGVTVAVASGKFSDAAANFNVDGADANNALSFVIAAPAPTDTTPPTIALAAGQVDASNKTTEVTFTLSEAATDFSAADVVVTGGTLSNFSGSGTSYTATITAAAFGEAVGVAVASGKFSDAAGNVNVDGADANNALSFTIDAPTPTDTTPPTVAISSSKASLIAGETAVLTFTLSEAATDFTAADVTATGGAVSNFTGSGTTYTAIFTPTAGATTGSVSVASGVLSDAAGNFNTAGSVTTLTLDTITPTVAVTAGQIDQANKTMAITFALSEASTMFNSSDVTVTGGTLSNFAGSGTSYTATVTAAAFGAGVVVAVPNGQFSDAAGNWNADGAEANNTLSFVIDAPVVVDTTPPTIAMTADKTTLDATNSTSVVTFTLSEASTNFDINDVTVAGGALSNFTGSGTSYTATYTANTFGTANTIAVASGAFTDAANNANADGADTNNTVVFTTVAVAPPPTITNTALDFSRIENATTGTLFQATGNNVSTWSLAGEDAAQFAIDTAGNVTFVGAVDFENASDADKDAVYHVTVKGANSAGVAVSKDFNVSVTDTTELPTWLAAGAPYGTSNKGVQSLLSADGVQSSWAGAGATNTPKSLTYSFQNSGAFFEDDFGGLVATDGAYSDEAKSFIRSVFQYFGSVSNVTLSENTSQTLNGADIRLFAGTAATLAVDINTLGYAYQPEAIPKAYMGDLFFVTDSAGLDGLVHPAFTSAYSNEHATIAHELGHALGLDHPFNSDEVNGGFSPYDDTVNTGVNYDGITTGGAHNTPLTDTVMETIMTYHNPNLGPLPDEVYALYAQTYTPWQPGIYDIAALQNLYGANFATNAGNNQYTFSQSSPSYTTIWDGGGTDTITHDGSNSALINLNEGTLSHVGTTPGWQLQDVYSQDIASVQVATATNGTAVIDAGSKSYTFTANMAQGGFDGQYEVQVSFVDGTSYLADYGQSIAAAVTDASQYNLGIAFGVTIENAVGGSAADTIIGNSAANHITGNGGDDVLTGGAGGDTFVFADIFGQDTISDFTHGQDVLQFSSAMANTFSFSGNTLTVAGYGSVVLTGITDMVLGTDYVLA